MIIDANGRVIVNPLATGEVSLTVVSGTTGGMTSILDKKQAIALRLALLDCIYPGSKREPTRQQRLPRPEGREPD